MHDLAKLAAKRTLRVAGLMSGTSADGIDVAIVEIGRRVIVRAFGLYPYPPAVREAIFALFRPESSRVDDICHMNALLGELLAQAVLRLCRRSGIPVESLDLIGSHGQTVWHIPAGRVAPGLGRKRKLRSTLQIGEPSIIAERTGVTTVADFRPRDLAAGGQGAPLVPYTDYILFAHPRVSRGVQNIGGIANVTYLPAGGGPPDVLAFDTGPGNMILDRLVSRLTDGRKTYDRGGAMASRGRVCESLLARWLQHPYFRRRPPKTTGREEFGTHYADDLLTQCRRARLSDVDILATATALTARSIAQAYRRLLPAMPQEVILCGGGARNATLRTLLAAELPASRVRMMDELGISVDAKEAVSFAILAAETIRGHANNLPGATGAARRAILGKILPGR